jgi:hypothetical protein
MGCIGHFQSPFLAGTIAWQESVCERGREWGPQCSVKTPSKMPIAEQAAGSLVLVVLAD